MNSRFDNESTTKVNNNISNNSLKDKIMKKFVFAAIAAMVMVSVSNVFASSKMMGNSEVAPVDTVAPADSTEAKASETPVEQVENAQPTEEVKAQDAPVENTQQESTEQTVADKAVEQQAVAE
jgi:Rieske Fe-S protein